MSIDVGGMTPAAADEESDDRHDDYLGLAANLSNYSQVFLILSEYA